MQLLPLDRRLASKPFHCGNSSLDEYLRRYALQDQRRRLAACYVLVDSDTTLGYYTLSAASLIPAALPPDERRVLPRNRPIPAILLGRLAVSLDHQRQGYGELLLADAIQRCVALSLHLGVFALVVDAKPQAAQFYIRFGFTRLQGDHNRLFLALSTSESHVP